MLVGVRAEQFDDVVALSLTFLSAATLALFTLNYRLFAKGYRLRA